nr:hypothetical protein [Tanacetum cinerariifolium]
MITPTVTSSTDSQMHNNIMAAGSRDQKCILNGPYKPTTVVVQAVAATDDFPVVLEHIIVETPMNMSPANKAHFKSKKEAIHLILTEIGDEIYSTVMLAKQLRKCGKLSKDMDEEIDEQELEAHYSYMAKIQVVPTADIETYSEPLEKVQNDTGYNVFANELQHSEQSESIEKDTAFCRFAKDNNTAFWFLRFGSRVLALASCWFKGSSTDACNRRISTLVITEVWEAIERLQQAESLIIQDVKTKLFWEFGKFTSHDGETIESYYTRFYKLMNEMIRNNLTVATMQVNAQFLQQLQPEWSRSHTTTRYKGKEIAKPITPPSESASKENRDPEQAQRDKDMQKNLALIAKNQRTMHIAGAKENVGSLVVQQSGIQCFNYKEFGHFAKEYNKPKRVRDSAYHKEKMLLCKQAEKGVSLQAEQYDWLADTDEEIDEHELEAHYSYMERLRSNVILDSPDMCDDDIQNDQNDVESDDERVVLANLIANLKLDVDENKKIQKQLMKANITLA